MVGQVEALQHHPPPSPSASYSTTDPAINSSPRSARRRCRKGNRGEEGYGQQGGGWARGRKRKRGEMIERRGEGGTNKGSKKGTIMAAANASATRQGSEIKRKGGRKRPSLATLSFFLVRHHGSQYVVQTSRRYDINGALV